MSPIHIPADWLDADVHPDSRESSRSPIHIPTDWLDADVHPNSRESGRQNKIISGTCSGHKMGIVHLLM